MDAPDEADDLSAVPSQDSFLRRLAHPVRGAPALAPGARLGEKYVIQRVIGVGGMGEVYLARDESLGRDVAIKRHHAGRDLERLRREAQVMAKLAHPAVVSVFEVGELAQGCFVVMEYVPGATLRGYLATRSLGARSVLELLCMAGDGLAAAHAANIVHRDFKPENVLVSRDGRARVSDFGLASDRDLAPTAPSPAIGAANDEARTWSMPGELALASTLSPPTQALAQATLPGTVMGTPAYMAPEQARGEVVDARADQYSFCVVAWEALFGERPRAGQRGRGPRWGRARHWRKVLARGLSANRTDRYPDMAALLADLRSYRAWRAPLAASAVIALGGALWWWRPWVAPPTCDAAAVSVDAEGILARVSRAAQGTTPLGMTAERWLGEAGQAAQVACHARLSGAWDPALAARSRACEATRRATLREALGPLSGGSSAQAREELGLRLLRLPPPAACAEPQQLLGMPAPPAGEGEQAAATRMRAASVAAALIGSATPGGDATVAYVASLLELLRAQGNVDPRRRAAALEAARTRALADGDAPTALAATAARLTFAAEVERDPVALAGWLSTAAADARAHSAAAPHAAVTLHLAAAAAELARAELSPPAGASTRTEELAAAWVAKALALLPASPTSLAHVEALLRRGELQLDMGRFADGKADLVAARDTAVALAGAGSALAGRVAARAAYVLVRAGQRQVAQPYQREAHAALETVSGDDKRYPLVARERRALRHWLGLGYFEDGDAVRGFALLEPLLVAEPRGDRASLEIVVALALASLDRVQPDKAASLLSAELEAQRAVLGAEHPELGVLAFNLGVALRDTGELAGAAHAAKDAENIWRKSGDNERARFALTLRAAVEISAGRPRAAVALLEPIVLGEQHAGGTEALAWPQVEYARALIALGEQPAEAALRLATARQLYEVQGAAKEIARIDALLAELRTARAAKR